MYDIAESTKITIDIGEKHSVEYYNIFNFVNISSLGEVVGYFVGHDDFISHISNILNIIKFSTLLNRYDSSNYGRNLANKLSYIYLYFYVLSYHFLTFYIHKY